MTEAFVEVHSLTKKFGAVTAVDDLSFSVGPGRIVGFLGPNGSGKTTTMRALLGLVAPTSGTATISGQRYADLRDPIAVVGAVLESTGHHPARSAIDHLRILAVTSGLPAARPAEVLDEVGLSAHADRAVGGYSLGMRQRLALAAAILGRPKLLVLDEPSNGLDPEGIAWLREFLRYHADGGGTVLLSSHVLSEVAQIVDEVVIIARGRLVTQAHIGDLVSRARESVFVRGPDVRLLADALSVAGHAVTAQDASSFSVDGAASDVVGELAAQLRVVLHELTPQRSSLEAVFIELTSDRTAP